MAPALRELVGERATEVLPALLSLLLENILPSRKVGEAIRQSVDPRRLSGHSIAVSHWETRIWSIDSITVLYFPWYVPSISLTSPCFRLIYNSEKNRISMVIPIVRPLTIVHLRSPSINVRMVD